MFAVVQFPFADVRPFIHATTNRLRRPAWPDPRPGTDFVRGFGAVRRRLRGGQAPWVGEGFFCDGRSALRFRSARISNDPLNVKCAFRRWYADGEALGRFEIGLYQRDLMSRSDRLGPATVLSVIDALLNTPVRTADAGGFGCLARAGKDLASYYLRATTAHSDDGTPEDVPSEWVTVASEPLLIIEYSGIASLPEFATGIKLPSGRSFHFLRVPWGGTVVGVFLIPVALDLRELRQLRLHLNRIYTEEAVFRQTFRLVREDRIEVPPEGSEALERLQDYANRATRVLGREGRFGLPQAEILAVAFVGREVMAPEDDATLRRKLQVFRRQVTVKVEERVTNVNEVDVPLYVNLINIETDQLQLGDGRMDMREHTEIRIGDGAYVAGNVVAAKEIQRSFNTVREADVASELKDRLEQLHAAVAKMIDELPEETATKVAHDLKMLSMEASSNSPRKRWYELSADGLVEAAKTVGKVGKPVIDVVKALLPLLA